MQHRGKTARTLPFTLEMYAEPQTRAELVITDLPSTILVKIDTDTNPNRQGGPAPVPTFHTVTDTLRSERASPRDRGGTTSAV